MPPFLPLFSSGAGAHPARQRVRKMMPHSGFPHPTHLTDLTQATVHWRCMVRYMEVEHGPTLGVMRTIKRALDPDNRMNPGKMLAV